MMLENMVQTVEKIQETITHPKGWIVVTAIFYFINHYVFSQWNFAIGFFMIFIIDTLVGTYVAWHLKEFSGKVFRKMLCDKSLAYFAIIISFSVATKITLEDGGSLHLDILNIPFYALFTTVEISSIVQSIYKYKKWEWLKPLMKHFDGYNSKDGKEEKDAAN